MILDSMLCHLISSTSSFHEKKIVEEILGKESKNVDVVSKRLRH